MARFLWVMAAVMIAGGVVVGIFGLPGEISNPTLQSVGALSSPSFYFVSDLSRARQYAGSFPTTRVIQGSSTSTGPPFELGPTPSNQTLAMGHGSVEFSSTLTMLSTNPWQAAGRVVALAYSSGGYVASQTTSLDSAYVVVRIPAAAGQQAISEMEGYGTVVSLSSSSNDVTVEYTDLNATLMSLQTEENAILRLLNQSTTLTNTLNIEAQLQSVDAQINTVRSKILQMRTLIQFATISVNITKAAEELPLAITLKASPKSGAGPLSVTFTAVARGGTPSYEISYNFGDGTTAEGRTVIHWFAGGGDYNVTASASDSEGNVTSAWVLVHVKATGQDPLGSFLGRLAGTFVAVIEGILEVAVVVIPLGLVGLAILYPLQKRWKKAAVKPAAQ